MALTPEEAMEAVADTVQGHFDVIGYDARNGLDVVDRDGNTCVVEDADGGQIRLTAEKVG